MEAFSSVVLYVARQLSERVHCTIIPHTTLTRGASISVIICLPLELKKILMAANFRQVYFYFISISSLQMHWTAHSRCKCLWGYFTLPARNKGDCV